MNYSLSVFLINDNVRAIACTYEQDAPDRPAGRTIFKSLDATLKAGDFVVIPTDTRHKLTVVKIVETDVDVDYDSHDQMTWIVGKVDLTDHELVLRQEAEAITSIKSAEKRKKQDELRKALIIDQQAIKALAIAHQASDEPTKSE